jgi:hypothetical protein
VAPAAPQQRSHDDPPRANRIHSRDFLRDFERDSLEVYNSPQTNLGSTLAALNHLEDSPTVRRLQANVRVAATQIKERGPRYSRSVASSYSRSRSECPLHRRCSQAPPANPAANVVANAPANPVANAPANPAANAPANAIGNVANNAANATNIQRNVIANPEQNAGAQPPPVQVNQAQGS